MGVVRVARYYTVARYHTGYVNSLILFNSSFLTDQLFINHFFYIFEDYIYLCVVNIFFVSFSIINSLSIFCWLGFLILSTHGVGGFPGGAGSICH